MCINRDNWRIQFVNMELVFEVLKGTNQFEVFDYVPFKSIYEFHEQKMHILTQSMHPFNLVHHWF